MYSYFILFGCIAKSHYCGEETVYFPYQTISKLSACHVSDGQSLQRLVFEHGSFHLDFVKLKMFLYAWFCSGRFLKLTLRTHTITTHHTTQSHNSTPSLTKTAACIFLKNINKEPSQQVGVLYTESCGLLSGF